MMSSPEPWGVQHLAALREGRPTPCLNAVHGDSSDCGQCVVCKLDRVEAMLRNFVERLATELCGYCAGTAVKAGKLNVAQIHHAEPSGFYRFSPSANATVPSSPSWDHRIVTTSPAHPVTRVPCLADNVRKADWRLRGSPRPPPYTPMTDEQERQHAKEREHGMDYRGTSPPLPPPSALCEVTGKPWDSADPKKRFCQCVTCQAELRKLRPRS